MPGVVEAAAAAKAAGVLADNSPVLPNDDAIGIGLDLDRPADGTRGHRVLVVVEANEASLRDRSGDGVEAIEPPGNRHQVRPLRREHLPDRLLGDLGMLVRLGVGDAAIEQQGIQLLVAGYPQPRREETLASQPDLVLDLPLFPTGGRRARHRLDEIMTAHLQETAVELAILANKHRHLAPM